MGVLPKGLQPLAWVIFVAIWLSTTLCGCANQTGEANELINGYNTHISEYNNLDKDASALMGDVNTSAGSKEDFEENIEVLEEVEVKIDQQLAELVEASGLLEEAQDLDIDKTLKTYIEMEQEANKASQELTGTAKELAIGLKDIYEAMNIQPGPDQAELEEKTEIINGLNAELGTQKQKVEELKDKASTYYREHNIG